MSDVPDEEENWIDGLGDSTPATDNEDLTDNSQNSHSNAANPINSGGGVNSNSTSENNEKPTETIQPSEDMPDLDEVCRTVSNQFDERLWNVTEAVLSTQATLLLEGVGDCDGLVIIGPPGSGKTTALQFIQNAMYGGEEVVYRSDDMTPAAWVSQDASREEDELADIDLLPQIQHKTLLNLDMNSWFSGNYENIRSHMSYLAKAMDGDGLVRNTGAHGQRGYEGDYRFGLLGATTPLESRAWDAMGSVGNRLVFHELPAKGDISKVSEAVFDETEFTEKRRRCQSEVSEFVSQLWKYYGGYSGVSWESSIPQDAVDAITYLANLINHVRAPVGKFGEQNEPQRGDAFRVMEALKNIARGHALVCGRQKVLMDDIDVCSRVALSTMHKGRRGIVRAVVDPNTGNPVSSREITEHDATSATRKTLQKRMKLLQDLGLGDVTVGDSGRDTKKFILKNDFVWPDSLPYPRFWE